MNLYLVLGTVEAGFLNLWIIGYAVMLLLWGQRGEAVVRNVNLKWPRRDGADSSGRCNTGGSMSLCE